MYDALVRATATFARLQQRHQNGENLLIIEVDGPHQESINYYKQNYGVGDEFIINDTMLCTRENLGIMLNDPKHPFGHGYFLAVLPARVIPLFGHVSAGDDGEQFGLDCQLVILLQRMLR